MSKPKRSAKGQFVSSRKAKVTRVKKRRRNPDGESSVSVAAGDATPNPPIFNDLVEFVLPGFAGFGATKFISRIVNVQLSKKFPNGSKHIAAGSTVIAFLAAWFLLHRVKRLAKYHTPAVVGSAIASLQTIVQTYMPKYGWMVSDYQDGPKQLAAAAGGGQRAALTANAPTLFPGGPEIVDDDEEIEANLDDELDNLDLGILGSGGELDAETLAGLN